MKFAFGYFIFSFGICIIRKSINSLLNFDFGDKYTEKTIIGIASSIVTEITNGKINFLKWDRQERMYYPLKINLYEKGEINVD